jgi:hypothetical protein
MIAPAQCRHVKNDERHMTGFRCVGGGTRNHFVAPPRCFLQQNSHAPKGTHATRLLVISCRTAAGTLAVTSRPVSSSGRLVRRLGDSGEQSGGIESNALMSRPTGVLSAVKAANGNLLLIGWGIDANGQVTRLGDSADQAGGIGLVRLGNDTGHDDAPILTCVQTEAGDLMLITWDDQPAHGELN